MARTDASTPGWRRRELILLVFPVLGVLAAADDIGDRPSGAHASGWGWLLGASASRRSWVRDTALDRLFAQWIRSRDG